MKKPQFNEEKMLKNFKLLQDKLYSQAEKDFFSVHMPWHKPTYKNGFITCRMCNAKTRLT